MEVKRTMVGLCMCTFVVINFVIKCFYGCLNVCLLLSVKVSFCKHAHPDEFRMNLSSLLGGYLNPKIPTSRSLLALIIEDAEKDSSYSLLIRRRPILKFENSSKDSMKLKVLLQISTYSTLFSDTFVTRQIARAPPRRLMLRQVTFCDWR